MNKKKKEKNKIISFPIDGGKKRSLDISDMYQTTDAMIILKRKRVSLFWDDPELQYHEGCDFLGYMPNGDSFLFTQGMMFDEKNNRRTIFCMTRRMLEKILKQYPVIEEK